MDPVMPGERDRPLAVLGNGGSLLKDVRDGEAVFFEDCQEKLRRQPGVEGQVASNHLPIGGGGLFQPFDASHQKSAREAIVDMPAELLPSERSVRPPIRYLQDGKNRRVQEKAIHSHPEPAVGDLQDSLLRPRIRFVISRVM